MLARRCKCTLDRAYCKRGKNVDFVQILDPNRKDRTTDKPKEIEAARNPNTLGLALERRSEQVHNSLKHNAIFLTAHKLRLSTGS